MAANHDSAELSVGLWIDKNNSSSRKGQGLYLNSNLKLAGLQASKGKLTILVGFLYGNFFFTLHDRDLRICDPVATRKENHSANPVNRLQRQQPYTRGRGNRGRQRQKKNNEQ